MTDTAPIVHAPAKLNAEAYSKIRDYAELEDASGGDVAMMLLIKRYEWLEAEVARLQKVDLSARLFLLCAPQADDFRLALLALKGSELKPEQHEMATNYRIHRFQLEAALREGRGER